MELRNALEGSDPGFTTDAGLVYLVDTGRREVHFRRRAVDGRSRRSMTLSSHIARLFDELFGAVDSLVSRFAPPDEEVPVNESASGDSQEADVRLLANVALKKVKKNDYCGFGRALMDKVLRQFIVANSEGRVTWKDGTGCFKPDIEVCVTPEDPPTALLNSVQTQGKCLRVCVDGECVYIC